MFGIKHTVTTAAIMARLCLVARYKARASPRLLLLPQLQLVSRFTTTTTTTTKTPKQQDQHVIVALGGNALLRRGQALTAANQRDNIRAGMASLVAILQRYKGVTIVHGNGPQSGLLVLESAAYEKATGLAALPLDVIDAETEGMIGYGLEQELAPHLPAGRGMATLLSQILVDPDDPAFANPTKV